MFRPTLVAVVTICLVLAASPAARGKGVRTDRHGDPLPPGAIVRLGTIRLRTAEHTAAVAFSPNGKILASADALSPR